MNTFSHSSSKSASRLQGSSSHCAVFKTFPLDLHQLASLQAFLNVLLFFSDLSRDICSATGIFRSPAPFTSNRRIASSDKSLPCELICLKANCRQKVRNYIACGVLRIFDWPIVTQFALQAFVSMAFWTNLAGVASMPQQWQVQEFIEGAHGFLPCPGRALLHSGRNKGPCCQAMAFSSVRLSRDLRSSTMASWVALLGKMRTDVTSDRNTPKQMPEILVNVNANAPAEDTYWLSVDCPMPVANLSGVDERLLHFHKEPSKLVMAMENWETPLFEARFSDPKETCTARESESQTKYNSLSSHWSIFWGCCHFEPTTITRNWKSHQHKCQGIKLCAVLQAVSSSNSNTCESNYGSCNWQDYLQWLTMYC